MICVPASAFLWYPFLFALFAGHNVFYSFWRHVEKKKTAISTTTVRRFVHRYFQAGVGWFVDCIGLHWIAWDCIAFIGQFWLMGFWYSWWTGGSIGEWIPCWDQDVADSGRWDEMRCHPLNLNRAHIGSVNSHAVRLSITYVRIVYLEGKKRKNKGSTNAASRANLNPPSRLQ